MIKGKYGKNNAAGKKANKSVGGSDVKGKSKALDAAKKVGMKIGMRKEPYTKGS